MFRSREVMLLILCCCASGRHRRICNAQECLSTPKARMNHLELRRLLHCSSPKRPATALLRQPEIVSRQDVPVQQNIVGLLPKDVVSDFRGNAQVCSRARR
ncbi:hypothetical protein OBBRIDRAFT_596600 [Obba rivulosa]|uniref:Uncharacterized protein n=1 Tax=Obba rivulosa TaxID=1052685 RepID=A0A8E2B1J1_9APHY|nr:hypothetical protein OBBRIDRAFT_596600 [Obba rivulosa]